MAMNRRDSRKWWDAFRSQEQRENAKDALREFLGQRTWHLWLTVTSSRLISREGLRSKLTRCLAGRLSSKTVDLALCALEPHQKSTRWHAHILMSMRNCMNPSKQLVDILTGCPKTVFEYKSDLTSSIPLWRYWRDLFDKFCGHTRCYPITSSGGALTSYLFKYALKSTHSTASTLEIDIDDDNFFLI